MNKFLSTIVAAGLVLSMSSCQSQAKESDALVKVFKYDESLQCEGPGIDIDVMAQELIDKGIQIKCSASSNDGMMRMMMCGADTGNIHVFQISKADLSAAQALGFALTETLPQFQDDTCGAIRVEK